MSKEFRRAADTQIAVLQTEMITIKNLLQEVRDELKLQRELHAKQSDLIILENRVIKLEEFKWYIVGSMAIATPVISYLVNRFLK
jgi:hypothetical protein